MIINHNRKTCFLNQNLYLQILQADSTQQQQQHLVVLIDFYLPIVCAVCATNKVP